MDNSIRCPTRKDLLDENLSRRLIPPLQHVPPDYSSLLPLADDAPALLAEINLVLAATEFVVQR